MIAEAFSCLYYKIIEQEIINIVDVGYLTATGCILIIADAANGTTAERSLAILDYLLHQNKEVYYS